MKIISTITEIEFGPDPADIVYQLKESEYICFLDSSLVPDKYSRFSYIGWQPSFIIKSHGLKNEFINISKKIKNFSYQHPLKFFKENVNDFIFHAEKDKKDNIRIVQINEGKARELNLSYKNRDSNVPDFIGGFMGYFSYDLKDHIEKLPHTTTDDQGLPIIYLGFYNKLLAYDHERDKWHFIRNFIVSNEKGRLEEIFGESDLIGSGDGIGEIIRRNSSEIKTIKERFKTGPVNIKAAIIEKYLRNPVSGLKIKSDLTKDEYVSGVNRTRDHIYAGDIYQVNFSQRFKAEVTVEAMDLYYILREKNAAPFSAYLSFPEFSIGSSSPERFLYLKDGIIETRPIKGTMPRGKDRQEDLKNARVLAASIKDGAELNMIVDLERNDLGKFCYYGTVKVIEHAVIEKYARVFHTVSTITGQVKKGIDVADIIRATFPGGSITGAPKIRAMEIIDELESVNRGLYTGSIGYISIDNTMDLNIVIRTFIMKDNRFYYNVGGGIVADSRPGMEYQETLDKGIALEDTLNYFRHENLLKVMQEKAGS